jgi:glycosyltransferase involved in cell wall biosynthesis
MDSVRDVDPTATTLVIVPAWNESASIAATLRRVRENAPGMDVVVVDDGSTDGTADLARAEGVVVLPLPYNLGVGGAMRTGFRYAWRHGYPAVVQVDADGQHDARDIATLVAALDHADIAIGSRFSGGVQRDHPYAAGPARRGAMAVLNRTLSLIARRPFTDVTSGFRAANRRAIAQYLRYYPLDYLGDTVDSLVAAIRSGLVVTEVPVRMHARTGGRPSAAPFRSALYLARAVLALGIALTRARSPRLPV